MQLNTKLVWSWSKGDAHVCLPHPHKHIQQNPTDFERFHADGQLERNPLRRPTEENAAI